MSGQGCPMRRCMLGPVCEIGGVGGTPIIRTWLGLFCSLFTVFSSPPWKVRQYAAVLLASAFVSTSCSLEPIGLIKDGSANTQNGGTEVRALVS